MAAAAAPLKLALLLPVTSRPSCSSVEVLSGLRRLAASLTRAPHNDGSLLVLLGINLDDDQLLQQQDAELAAFSAVGCAAEVVVFSPHPPGALCHLWALLATAAVQRFGCNLAVLLGGCVQRLWQPSLRLKLAHPPAQPALGGPGRWHLQLPSLSTVLGPHAA
jgi:hypothetical protein